MNILNKWMDYDTICYILSAVSGSNTYAVEVSYSHTNPEKMTEAEISKNVKTSIEVFEYDPCDRSIVWFNDWYEGEPFIKISYVFDIEDLYDMGIAKEELYD